MRCGDRSVSWAKPDQTCVSERTRGKGSRGPSASDLRYAPAASRYGGLCSTTPGRAWAIAPARKHVEDREFGRSKIAADGLRSSSITKAWPGRTSDSEGRSVGRSCCRAARNANRRPERSAFSSTCMVEGGSSALSRAGARALRSLDKSTRAGGRILAGNDGVISVGSVLGQHLVTRCVP